MSARTGPPGRASSVWPGMSFMRGEEGQLRLIHLTAVLTETRRQCAERRARVLEHDWARRQLCLIFGYRSAEQWNGYVPPKLDPAEDKTNLSRLNTSPFRRSLIQLLTDVAEYERTGVIPAHNPPPSGQQMTIPTGEG